MIKNITLLALLVLLAFGCGRQQVEKHLEDGVEVLVNHLEPYQIGGQSPSLHLEEVMILDTEAPEVVAAGVIDINSFQVDSAGNIYILSRRGENHFFYNRTLRENS